MTKYHEFLIKITRFQGDSGFSDSSKLLKVNIKGKECVDIWKGLWKVHKNAIPHDIALPHVKWSAIDFTVIVPINNNFITSSANRNVQVVVLHADDAINNSATCVLINIVS